jgi:hypothetical protein
MMTIHDHCHATAQQTLRDMRKQQYDECLQLVARQQPAGQWTAYVAVTWYPNGGVT